jgi:tetratricopeptide (TPR) repeat protein
MKTRDLHFYLERYLNEEMSEAERIWFEKELEGNDSLQQELRLRRATNDILARSDEMTLRMKLAGIEQEFHHDRRKVPAYRKSLRYIAVAVIAIMVAGGIYLPNRTLSHDTLFERYYYLPPTAEQSVSRSLGASSSDHHFMMAINSYNSEDYQSAIDYFLTYTEENESSPGITMMLGNSFMEISEYGKAGDSYERVIDHDNNLYIEDANWMLGLCYLKTGEVALARMKMTAIAESHSRYRKDAAAILRRLRKR